MKKEGENMFGINWNPIDLVESQEEDDNNFVKTNFPDPRLLHTQNDPSGFERESLNQDHTDPPLSDADLRKITIYLPNALFQKMRQQKKRRMIRSYSEAISNALEPLMK